jgi:8-oxo-dGTP diphosphatase
MVNWGNFKQRIELCLNEELHPFYVEFSIPLKDC